MNRLLFLLFFCLIIRQTAFCQKVVFGYVKDADSGEPLIGVNVQTFPANRTLQTNVYGFFTTGNTAVDSLQFSYVGYATYTLRVGNSLQNPVEIKLKSAIKELREASFIGNRETVKPEIGIIKLTGVEIKQIPALGGEKDVLKAIQLLPGVQKGAEGSTSLFVRGGGADQNLILLDEAVVYNPNHFFGIFSVFNADAIKNVDFYKGGFPASLGGRLSSFINIQQKEGDKTQIRGTGSIGILTSKLTLEGPIKKEKSSFLISGRRTNLDPIFWFTNTPEQGFSYRFYDLNAKLSFTLNSRNKLYISGFTGNDKLNINEETTGRSSGINSKINTDLGWGNSTFSANWFSVLNAKTSLNTVVTFTDYNSIYDESTVATSPENEVFRQNLAFGSGIRDFTVKSSAMRQVNANRTQEAGLFYSNRDFTPRIFSSLNIGSSRDTSETQQYGVNEVGAFLSEKISFANRFQLSYGLRYTLLTVDSETYSLYEPRLQLSYKLPNEGILKAAFDRTTQTVNLLQPSNFGLSTDFYVPATARFKPQSSNQISLGYETAALKKQLIISAETYVKRQQDILSFKEGVWLFALIDEFDSFDWEERITSGEGLSYGAEFSIRKPSGRLTGWLSYTWQKSTVIFEELNNGLPFHPFQDRRHDITVFGNFQLNNRVRLSANWIMTSGSPITLPIGYYFTGIQTSNVELLPNTGIEPISYFGGRNFGRMPWYHRLDLSVAIKGKERSRRWRGEWEIGVFNAYNRRNPFNAFLKLNNSLNNPGAGTSLEIAYSSLLPIIPSVSYNFTF